MEEKRRIKKVEDSFKVNNYSRPVAISTSIFLYAVSSGALDQWTLTHLSKTSVGERWAQAFVIGSRHSGRPDRVQLVILSVSSLFPPSVRFNGRLDRVLSFQLCRYFAVFRIAYLSITAFHCQPIPLKFRNLDAGHSPKWQVKMNRVTNIW